MQFALDFLEDCLEREVLVSVGLLERAGDLGGVGRPEHVVEPGSKEHSLGPLAGQAVGEDDRLAVLLLDEVDAVGGDFLVCPRPGLPPDLDVVEDSLARGGLELHESV